MLIRIPLAFCNFLTVTQRMCMAVSPWTMVLSAWLDYKDRRRNGDQQRCQDESPSSLREKITTKADSNDGFCDSSDPDNTHYCSEPSYDTRLDSPNKAILTD